jgi:uncharacterized membrane protein
MVVARADLTAALRVAETEFLSAALTDATWAGPWVDDWVAKMGLRLADSRAALMVVYWVACWELLSVVLTAEQWVALRVVLKVVLWVVLRVVHSAVSWVD